MIPEIWVTCVDNPIYEVSSHGRVRSTDHVTVVNIRKHGPHTRKKKGKILKLINNGDNYKVVNFGHSDRNYVHRLVAKAFVGNPENMPFVNHLDGDTTNNLPSNLRWTDMSGNMQHAYNIGLNKRGTESKRSKVDLTTALKIRADYARGDATYAILAQKYGVGTHIIGKCVRGEYLELAS